MGDLPLSGGFADITDDPQNYSYSFVGHGDDYISITGSNKVRWLHPYNNDYPVNSARFHKRVVLTGDFDCRLQGIDLIAGGQIGGSGTHYYPRLMAYPASGGSPITGVGVRYNGNWGVWGIINGVSQSLRIGNGGDSTCLRIKRECSVWSLDWAKSTNPDLTCEGIWGGPNENNVVNHIDPDMDVQIVWEFYNSRQNISSITVEVGSMLLSGGGVCPGGFICPSSSSSSSSSVSSSSESSSSSSSSSSLSSSSSSLSSSSESSSSASGIPIGVIGFTSDANTVEVPAGTQDGDMMIWFGGFDFKNGPNIPTGFTQISSILTGSDTMRCKSAYRIASGESPSGTYYSGQCTACALVTVRAPDYAVSGSGTWDLPTVAGHNSAKTESGLNLTLTTNPVYASNNQDLLLCGFFNDGGRTVDTPPAGMNHVVREKGGTSFSVDVYEEKDVWGGSHQRTITYTSLDDITGLAVLLSVTENSSSSSSSSVSSSSSSSSESSSSSSSESSSSSSSSSSESSSSESSSSISSSSTSGFGIQFGGYTANSGSWNGSHNITDVDVPAGTQDGDLLVWFAGYDGNGGINNLPGFTTIDSIGSAGFRGRTGFKIASSEPASYDDIYEISSSILVRLTKSGGTWDDPSAIAYLHSNKSGSGTSITSNQVTSKDLGDILLLGFMNDGGSSVTVPPVGMSLTEQNITGSFSTTVYQQSEPGIGDHTKSITYGSSDEMFAFAVVVSVVENTSSSSSSSSESSSSSSSSESSSSSSESSSSESSSSSSESSSSSSSSESSSSSSE